MENNLKELKEFIEIIEKLRDPGGCPWDREQTHSSLKKNILEEAYETVDAIDSNDIHNLKEELGDVLLQVVLHSQIASENNSFSIADVAKGIKDKMIRRHPHVFGDLKVSGTEEVLNNWEEIKKEEKKHRTSALDGVSSSQAALLSALQLSKKAVKVGFEWPNIESVWDCFNSEVEEFKQAVKSDDKENMEEELGDMLFAMVNIARWNNINPELALIKANKKFTERFKTMEQTSSKAIEECTLEELDELWNKAKISLKNKEKV